MKKILFFIFLSSSILSYSQNDSLFISSPKIKVDKTILIVPFNPQLYNVTPTAIQSIEKASGKTYDQILNYFRLSFDQQLNRLLNDTCTSLSMLASFTVSANEDLQLIYSIANYSFSPAMDYETGKLSIFSKSKLGKPKKEKLIKKHKKQSRVRGGEVVSKVSNNEEQFLHVTFSNENIIKGIAHESNVDYMLFINEFEIIGNYTSPYNIARDDYDLLIKIHYSLYNANAKYIFGSFATAGYKSYITDMKKITKQCFPIINKQILHNLPLKAIIK